MLYSTTSKVGVTYDVRTRSCCMACSCFVAGDWSCII